MKPDRSRWPMTGGTGAQHPRQRIDAGNLELVQMIDHRLIKPSPGVDELLDHVSAIGKHEQDLAAGLLSESLDLVDDGITTETRVPRTTLASCSDKNTNQQ